MLRPWPADDGLLVRLRVPGGQLPARALLALLEVAEQHGDGRVRTTSRANLQLRGLPADADGGLPEDVLAALGLTGLVPSPAHDLVRNVMTSPGTGLHGTGLHSTGLHGTGLQSGRSDLRPTTAELDRRLLADRALAALPGRFLFVLDDGRGDLVARTCDLGLVVLDAGTAQLRVGEEFGAVVPLDSAPRLLVELAHAFLDARGDGPGAAWHVAELPHPLDHPVAGPVAPDRRVPVPTDGLPFGPVGTHWHHLPDPPDGWGRADLAVLPGLAAAPDVVVTGSGLLVHRRAAHPALTRGGTPA